MSEPALIPSGLAWVPPAARGQVVAGRGRTHSVAAITAPDREAFRQGFEQGRREGLESAAIETREREWSALVQTFTQICDELARPLAHVDDETEQQLVRLAVAIGAQLARRELVADPALLLPLIREGIQALPINSRQVRVILHPTDAAAIRERIALPTEERAWTLVDDPAMSRGGCRILTEVSLIDARLETRVAATLGALLGDDRNGNRAPT